MSEIEKLKLLKNEYLKMEHPRSESWKKKVEVTFQEGHTNKKFSYPECLIRNLEYCLMPNRGIIRALGDEIVYTEDVKRKRKLEEKYSELIKEKK